MCHCSNLYHVYNNNYSFVILFCSQPFFQVTLVLYSAHNWDVQTLNFTQDWITVDCCPLWLAFLYTHSFSLQNVIKVEGSRSCLLENSLVTACTYALSYLSVRILIVVRLFKSCSMHLLLCICHNIHCLLLLSLSLHLLYLSDSLSSFFFLFVTFAYCFHVNDNRSSRVRI